MILLVYVLGVPRHVGKELPYDPRGRKRPAKPFSYSYHPPRQRLCLQAILSERFVQLAVGCSNPAYNFIKIKDTHTSSLTGLKITECSASEYCFCLRS